MKTLENVINCQKNNGIYKQWKFFMLFKSVRFLYTWKTKTSNIDHPLRIWSWIFALLFVLRCPVCSLIWHDCNSMLSIRNKPSSWGRGTGKLWRIFWTIWPMWRTELRGLRHSSTYWITPPLLKMRSYRVWTHTHTHTVLPAMPHDDAFNLHNESQCVWYRGSFYLPLCLCVH